MTQPALLPADKPRLVALDAFRGFTMLAMVLVNNPGSWTHIYAPLRHAPWNGLTPTDLIFPFFLFIVGVSFHVSAAKAIDSLGPLPWPKLLRRGLSLIAIGIVLNAFPFYPDFDPAHWRFTGVLQRIGLCFLLACAIIDLARRLRVSLSLTLAVIVLAILLVYGLLIGSPPRDIDARLLRDFDLRFIHKGHLYRGSFIDPEGLLATIPATATVLLGVVASRLAPADSVASRRSLLRLLGWSITIIACGGILAELGLSALNKTLWSSSYTLFSAGVAGLFFAALLALERQPSRRGLFNPRACLALFVVPGRNAIILFVGSGILARLLNLLVWETPEGSLKPVKDHAFLFLSTSGWIGDNPKLASLTYAIATLVLWWGVLWVLHRRKIYLKL